MDQAILKLVHEQCTLPNGLRVILHPDRRLPRVATNLLYRVGSRHDPRGRQGLAHLLEHMMFMGTRRVSARKFDLLHERVGGWSNAFTNEDVTVYYSVGPARLEETLLWIEGDRMATLAEALDGEKLRLQREVVLNELSQDYHNAPYGIAELESPGLMFGRRHPYGWPIIGAAADLRKVTVAELRCHLRRYYAPNNASLVVAGDFSVDKTLRLIERHLGWIPPAEPPSARPRSEPPRLQRELRRSYTSAVELPRLQLLWHTPAYLEPGDAEMELTAELLAGGKHCRLHRVLVYERRLASTVEAYQLSRQLGSLFVISVTASRGVEPARLEQATDELLAELRAHPPSEEEVSRVRADLQTEFVESMQRLRRRAEALNLYATFAGQPDFLAADFARYQRVTAQSLHRWAVRLLRSSRRGVVWVLPGRRP